MADIFTKRVILFKSEKKQLVPFFFLQIYLATVYIYQKNQYYKKKIEEESFADFERGGNYSGYDGITTKRRCLPLSPEASS